MSLTWDDGTPPAIDRPRGLAWGRVIARGVPMALVVFGGAVILVLVRQVERPLHGIHRPWTPHITRMACASALRLLGLRIVQYGQPGEGAVVANHSSWLDIFALNARDLVYFVSKSDVSGWPGIGWLAKITGTIFIERERRHAKAQTQVFEARLLDGHRLLFFPEGTSTDNQRVLPFKSTLFEAFRAPNVRDVLHLQPVSVVYEPPNGADPRFYGWWGDMSFGANLLGLLAAPRHGAVHVVYHPSLPVSEYPDRKALAAACEAAVRNGHAKALAKAAEPG